MKHTKKVSQVSGVGKVSTRPLYSGMTKAKHILMKKDYENAKIMNKFYAY